MVQPLPAPSLRELLSECEAEGVSPMNGKTQNIQSFVGAMKITRNPTVSGRYIEWYRRSPQCQSPARWMFCQRAGDFLGFCVGEDILPFIGVLVKPWGWQAIFIAPTKAQRWLHSTTHRGTLPQSRPFGRDSSLREGAGEGLHRSTGCSLKSQVTGDFRRPYEWHLPFIGGYRITG